MAVAGLFESKRLKVAQTHHLVNQTGCVVPMSVFRLVLQLAVIGFGEAFHYPGQVTLYYQEFPKSLRSTATAMISLIMGIAYYVSTAFVDLLQKITAWLPDNINKGRLDYVYWMFPLLGALNFGYFLIRTKFYK
ncbi:protein NRT1/ PTR FAMILY 2.6-like [Hevea brasiliensis]|uniref:protein NRT1/ PTR FAMILY 2.6-like n=1 Tax=Hevea brasiliensis TaxID=3981 RepID=UPI0025D33B86|nr:protein NRT1/ PTR FAMILY 2.6-like [Hevea brasiliensis]